MPTTFSELLPATKSSPHNGINWTPSESSPGGFLTIFTGRKAADYLVVEFGTPWEGRAFHFAKVTTGSDAEAESYDVFCCRHGKNNRCTCKGFEFSGNCKHIAAAVAIWENGWLPHDLPSSEQDNSKGEPPF